VFFSHAFREEHLIIPWNGNACKLIKVFNENEHVKPITLMGIHIAVKELGHLLTRCGVQKFLQWSSLVPFAFWGVVFNQSG
jgi:hypothetical protein